MHDVSKRSSRIEALEHRRLLSLTPFGTETAVHPAPGIVYDSDVAVAGDGSYLVASIIAGVSPQGASPTNFTATAVRYSATGRRIGAPLLLETLPVDRFAGQISAAMDDHGDAVVAYCETDRASDTTNAVPVHVVRISNQSEVSTPVEVSDPTRVAGDPAVSMDARGDYFVAWVQHWDVKTLEESVHVRAFDASGNPRGPDIKAAASVGQPADAESTISAFQFSDVSIAAKPDGSGAVYTFADKPPNGGTFIRVDRVGINAMIGHIREIPAGDVTIPATTDVAVHADGSFVVSYIQQVSAADGSFPNDHRLQRFDAAARPLGNPIDPDAGAKGTPWSDLAVAAMPDGGFVTTFFKTFKHIAYAYARHYDAAGVSLNAAPIELANDAPRGDTVASLNNTAVGADDRGNVVALYQTSPYDTMLYRRLTSDVAAVDKSVLYAFGTKADDSITVTSNKSRVAVRVDKGSVDFDSSQILAASITGGVGDDRIVNDTALPATLDGGSGDDTITGGTAADAIYGRAGSDRLFGGLGADRIYGNGGRDRLFGGGGDDRLFGGASADSLYGQNGSDQLFGEGGNDRLYGNTLGDVGDTLHGNGGDDFLFSKDAVVDHLFGDGGNDRSNADDIDIVESIEVII